LLCASAIPGRYPLSVCTARACRNAFGRRFGDRYGTLRVGDELRVSAAMAATPTAGSPAPE